MRFNTNFQYNDGDRQARVQYTWLKYQPILQESKILDVGADKCHLKNYLDDATLYTGIDLGGSPDVQVNLEKGSLPFFDNMFDCVLCLDVLEHVDNIHQVFDELCRVSRKYVVISLPNAWNSIWSMLRTGHYGHYGLPLERPMDRHKWFFHYGQAEKFISHRATKNNFKPNVQLFVRQSITKS